MEVFSPRYSHLYSAVLNRPSLLVESHSLKSAKTRAWAHYDVAMPDWLAGRDPDLLARIFPGAPASQAYWRSTFDRVSRGEVDTWDYQWAYATFKSDGVSVMPAVNLISNIGFGAEATHTHDPESRHANLSSEALPWPLTHPRQVAAEQAADEWGAEHVFGIDPKPPRPEHRKRGRGRRIRSRVRRLLRS